MYLAMGSIVAGVVFQSLFHVFVEEDNLNCCEEDHDVTVSGESGWFELNLTDYFSGIALPSESQSFGHAHNFLATARTPKIATDCRQVDRLVQGECIL